MTSAGLQKLKKHEGLRLLMYFDDVGAATIGYGHNLRDRPLTEAAADHIFDDDVADTTRELLGALPWITSLSPARQDVLENMAFNIGVGGLLGFKVTLAHIKEGRYHDAAVAMLDSKWALQVNDRATELAALMEHGVY